MVENGDLIIGGLTNAKYAFRMAHSGESDLPPNFWIRQEISRW